MRKNIWNFGINLFKNQNSLVKYSYKPAVSYNHKNYVTNTIQKHQETSIILVKIQKLLSCDIESAHEIYDKLPSIRNIEHFPKIEENVKIILSHEVSLKSIIDNHFVLIMPTASLARRLHILRGMKPLRMDDVLPLVEMDYLEQTEVRMDRIYYFSKKLKVQPCVVSKQFAKYSTMFQKNSHFKEKLKTLLDYEIPVDQILQNLYVFQNSHRRIVTRLEYLKSNGADLNLSTVKYSDKEFNSYIKKKHLEPIVATKNSISKNTEVEKSILWLQKLLQCDNVDAANIYHEQPNVQNVENLTTIKWNIELLKQNNISMQTVTSNPFLLTIPNDHIQVKLDILAEMQAKELSDFIPLAILTIDQLQQIKLKWKTDQPSIRESHRIYLFSHQLKIEPQEAARYFAKYPRMCFMPFEELKRKLALLLSLNASSDDFLGSMNHFLLSEETMQHKLDYLKKNGVYEIKPWMLSRPDHQLEEIVKQNSLEIEALNECKDIVEYLSKRLNWDEKMVNDMQRAYPPLFKSKASRVKRHLDCLLNDHGFTIKQINQHISIFRMNFIEMKNRINEYKSLNHSISGLSMLCLSKQRYLKNIQNICECIGTQDAFNKFTTIEKRLKEEK